MNNYEGIFIIRPDLKEDDVKNVIKAIGDSAAKNSAVAKKEEVWGKRQLAYPMKKYREGYYYKLEFMAPPAAIAKMEAVCKLNADIIRTLITRR